jgi:drug/metabolite transporter (DMT)-like permease
MESRFDIIAVVNAVCVAAYLAITLGYVALYFGLPGEEVRGVAMILAILIAALIAVDFYGKKLSNSD